MVIKIRGRIAKHRILYVLVRVDTYIPDMKDAKLMMDNVIIEGFGNCADTSAKILSLSHVDVKE